MSLVLGFAHSSGVRVAEVAFLLFVIAGVWIASASLTRTDKTHLALKLVVIASSRFRMTVAGILLATGGLLLIVAAHWGHLFA